MTIQHSAITDPQIHEPKGAAAAAADTVFVADGAGSGAFGLITSDSLNDTSMWAWVEAGFAGGDIRPDERFSLTVTIADISTAGFVLVPVTQSMTFISATMVLGAAIGTADANIAFVNAAAASMGTAAVVAFSGSAEGDLDTFTPTANAALTGPTYMKISTDGASTNTVPLYITLNFTIPA